MNFLKRDIASKLSLIARAFVFSVFCSVPAIYAFFSSGGYSPVVLSDWDEAYYLPYAYQTSEIPISSFFKFGKSNLEVFENYQLNLPHYSLDILLGRIVNFFNLRPVELGLSLDIVCVFAAYLLLSFFLRFLFSSQRLSLELGTIAAIKFPWLFSIDEILALKLGKDSPLKLYAHQFFPSESAFRASYTQISFISFILLLIFLLSTWRLKNYRSLWVMLSGISCGLLLYQYFFAWGVGLLLGLSSFSIKLIFDRRLRLSSRIIDLSSFLLTSLVISIPGLLLMFRGGKLFAPGPGLHMQPISSFLDFPSYWYFGPLSFLFAVSLAIYLIRNKKTLNSEFAPAILILVFLVAQFILVNLQPVLNRWMTPYHFPLFFIHPIICGVATICIFSFLKSLLLRRLGAGFLVIGLVFTVYIDLASAIYETKEHADLLRYLDEEVEKPSVIASVPFSAPLFSPSTSINYQTLAYWIRTFTKHSSFPLLLGYEPDRERAIQSELALALILSGEVQPLVACPTTPNVLADSTDVISGAKAFLEAQRLSECSIMAQLISANSACSLISQFSFDFIVLDTQIVSSVSETARDFTEKVWESSEKRYVVLKFSNETARAQFCRP